MAYKPSPINTDDIELPKDIIELREQLAKNIHENWANRRMEEGWTLGSHRDDEKKMHPCLIPYEELPEEEKDYDRLVAFETLKTIIALGYEIHKK